MKNEVSTVRENIFPFIVIGFLGGVVIGFHEDIESSQLISSYLAYANINIDLAKHAEGVFYEHFAPLSLSYLLIVLFSSCALHRIVLGAVENNHEGIGVSFILPLKNFSINLATAFLGLMLGISLPALFFDGWPVAVRFLVLCVYPIGYIILIKFITLFIYHEGTHSKSEWVDNRWKYKLGTRLEGLIILVLAIVMLTYHKQYIDGQDWLTKKILELL